MGESLQERLGDPLAVTLASGEEQRPEASTGDPELLLQSSAPGAVLRVASLGVTGSLHVHSQTGSKEGGHETHFSARARAVGGPGGAH